MLQSVSVDNMRVKWGGQKGKRRGWAKQNKQSKTNMAGCFKCGSQVHTRTHTHLSEWQIAKLKETKERKKIIVLKKEGSMKGAVGLHPQPNKNELNLLIGV